MSSKSSWATLCHFKKLKFSFTKTSHWKFLDLKPTHFAVRIAAPLGNNRSTAENLGEKCCTLEIHSPKSVDVLNRKNVFLWKLQKRSQWILLICGRFQFFTANPQMFAERNRFANTQTKTLSPQVADLRAALRKCPALLLLWRQFVWLCNAAWSSMTWKMRETSASS